MPFTLAHVAAVVPVAALSRRRLPFSALAIGSMIPDYPLFFSAAPHYASTHSLYGIVVNCLPIALVWLLIFQIFMKRPLLALLPVSVQERCQAIAEPAVEPSIRYIVGASAAIVVGAATHVFWDSFTHESRWGTTHFPALNQVALTIAGHPFPWYKTLQYGSSAAGLVFLAGLGALWLSRQPRASVEPRPPVPRWARMVTIAATTLLPLLVAGFVWTHDALSPYRRLNLSVTWGGYVWIVAVSAYCACYHLALTAPRWTTRQA